MPVQNKKSYMLIFHCIAFRFDEAHISCDKVSNKLGQCHHIYRVALSFLPRSCIDGKGPLHKIFQRLHQGYSLAL